MLSCRRNGRGRGFVSTETLLDELGFPEGPRWHAGRLWFSDFHQRKVRSVSLAGDVRVELEPDDVPSGLGWDPSGDLLVVSMLRRQLLRVGATTEIVADLSPWTVMGANDMAVDGRGRAYIGNFGYDFVNGEEPRPTRSSSWTREAEPGRSRRSSSSVRTGSWSTRRGNDSSSPRPTVTGSACTSCETTAR